MPHNMGHKTISDEYHHQSLYAYGDWYVVPVCIWVSMTFKSPYAYVDHANHHMHMGMVQSLTRLHMVLVCIWGFGHQIPICKHLHMGIPVCKQGSITKNRQNLHMVTPRLQMFVDCIW